VEKPTPLFSKMQHFENKGVFYVHRMNVFWLLFSNFGKIDNKDGENMAKMIEFCCFCHHEFISGSNSAPFPGKYISNLNYINFLVP